MTPQEANIDHYVTETSVMLARLGDHLTSLDSLRENQKNDGLAHFGFCASQIASFGDNLQQLVTSHLDRYDVHMASYLRSAHVMLTYMVFEDRLYAFSKLIVKTGRGTAFQTKPRKGSLIEQFSAYLTGISLRAPSYKDVESLRLIRNCITHNRGLLHGFGEEEKLASRIRTLIGITVAPSGHVHLTTEGCLRLQETVIRYLDEINSEAGFQMWIPPEVRRSFEEHFPANILIRSSTLETDDSR